MHEEARKYLAHRIKTARIDCNLTQDQLSEAAGLSLKTISDVENGHANPRFDNLCDILQALNLSFDGLLPSCINEDDTNLHRWINCYISSSKSNRKILLSNSENLYATLIIVCLYSS